MDAIFVADAATGIIVDCNPAASKLVEQGEVRTGGSKSIHHSSQRANRRRIYRKFQTTPQRPNQNP